MNILRQQTQEHVALLRAVGRWLLILAPMAIVVGSAAALFLWLLGWVTQLHAQASWLLYLLPLAGVAIAWLYKQVGRGTDAGNNLIMDSIGAHGQDDSSVVVPGRMAPLILLATLVSHLFGASVGREGTAVQMGGAIASRYGRWLKLNPRDTRIILMAGISAGFGGVFGTPIAAAVFALEVLAIGSIQYEAILPCLLAGLLANWASLAWGTQHAVRTLPAGLTPTGVGPALLLAGKVAMAGVLFGMASVLFATLTHALGGLFRRQIPNPLLRPAVGGVVIIGFTLLLGTQMYGGLGAPLLDAAFTPGGVGATSWLYKLLATALSLGGGFKGGEVTPLFIIGASLGNLLAGVLAAPVPLFAALGFAAVFGAATNTPLAGTLLGIELFGAEYAPLFAIACFVAYLFSGHNGVYLSQRIVLPKPGRGKSDAGKTLRHLRG